MSRRRAYVVAGTLVAIGSAGMWWWSALTPGDEGVPLTHDIVAPGVAARSASRALANPGLPATSPSESARSSERGGGEARMTGTRAREGEAAVGPKQKPAPTTVTLDVQQKPLGDVVQTIATAHGANVMVLAREDGSSPTVTLYIVEVPFERALQLLADSAGYRLVKDEESAMWILRP